MESEGKKRDADILGTRDNASDTLFIIIEQCGS